jgi:hypothetical protein
VNNGLWSSHRDKDRLSSAVPKVSTGAQGFSVWNLQSGIFDAADMPRGGHPPTPDTGDLAPTLKAASPRISILTLTLEPSDRRLHQY